MTIRRLCHHIFSHFKTEGKKNYQLFQAQDRRNAVLRTHWMENSNIVIFILSSKHCIALVTHEVRAYFFNLSLETTTSSFYQT